LTERSFSTLYREHKEINFKKDLKLNDGKKLLVSVKKAVMPQELELVEHIIIFTNRHWQIVNPIFKIKEVVGECSPTFK